MSIALERLPPSLAAICTSDTGTDTLTIETPAAMRRVDILGPHPAPGDGRQRQFRFDDGPDRGDFLASHRRRARLHLRNAGARQRARDRNLFLGREGDAGRLLAVAQRGIVENDRRERRWLIDHWILTGFIGGDDPPMVLPHQG